MENEQVNNVELIHEEYLAARREAEALRTQLRELAAKELQLADRERVARNLANHNEMQPPVQIQARGKKAKISPEIRSLVCVNVEAGMSRKQIAETFKISPSSITNILNQQRVALNDGEPHQEKNWT